MTCKHCCEGERKWFNSTDNRMRFQLASKKRGGGAQKKLRLRVHWNSWKMRREMDTTKSSDFNIIFCPMCGRDLTKSKF